MQLVSGSRFLAASAAAQDAPREGSAGCLFISPSNERLAYILEVDDPLCRLWDTQPAKIAQLELVVVLMAFAFYGPHVRHRHGIWFIDNVAALMALIRPSRYLDPIPVLVRTFSFLWVHWDSALGLMGAWITPWCEQHANRVVDPALQVTAVSSLLVQRITTALLGGSLHSPYIREKEARQFWCTSLSKKILCHFYG